MKKLTNIITFLIQAVLLIMVISTIVLLFKFENDFKFFQTQNEEESFIILLVYLLLFYPYRLTLILTFYSIWICLAILCFPITCFICINWCICPCFKNIRKNLKNYLKRVTCKFLIGSLDFFHLFICFKNCMPGCVDHFQPCLDVMGLIVDFLLFLSSFAVGGFIESQRVKGGNIAPVVILFLTCVPLLAMFVINVIRFRRNQKVSARIRDIFKSEELKFSDNVLKVFYEDSMGSKKCAFDNDCKRTDPEHRMKYHKKTDVFKLNKYDPDGCGNIVIGFHQTSIDRVRSIIQSEMQLSPAGWLGKGIYFTTSIQATNEKANNTGSIIIAEIDLGKVDEVNQTVRSSNPIRDGYQTRYLNHPDGQLKDEFIIRDPRQIKRYVVVVFKKTALEYRKNMKV